jgi:cell wall-associated NlpC family hydrolase
MPLGLVLIGGGVMLLWGAFTGEHPWAPVVQAFGGTPPAAPGGAGPTSTFVTDVGAGAPPAQPGSLVNTGGNRYGAAIVSAAEQWVGYGPYRLGGSGGSYGIDCSGLTRNVYQTVGISLPHSAALQYAACLHIAKAALSPGDLVFMFLGETSIHHVAIYIGGGQTIEAVPSRGGVGVSPLGYQPGPYLYGRPRQAQGT